MTQTTLGVGGWPGYAFQCKVPENFKELPFRRTLFMGVCAPLGVLGPQGGVLKRSLVPETGPGGGSTSRQPPGRCGPRGPGGWRGGGPAGCGGTRPPCRPPSPATPWRRTWSSPPGSCCSPGRGDPPGSGNQPDQRSFSIWKGTSKIRKHPSVFWGQKVLKMTQNDFKKNFEQNHSGRIFN